VFTRPPQAAANSDTASHASDNHYPNPQDARGRALDHLRRALTDFLAPLKNKTKFSVSKARNTLKLILGEGSLYITSTNRQRSFQVRINTLKSELDIISFADKLLTDFDSEFNYESSRLLASRLASSQKGIMS